MTTYVLIPGAGAGPWSWHLLADELRRRGRQVVAVDLPCEDDEAGLAEYADTVVRAVGDQRELVLVAHSFGGFTAPLVCDRLPVRLLVMLQALVPAPGETPGEWWANTGHAAARQAEDERGDWDPDDTTALFLHDTPPEVAAELLRRGREQSATPFQKPWPLAAWPTVPTRVLLARDDRFLPVDFMRRVVRERLGITPDEMPGDHCPMLGHPVELADRLEAYTSAL
ncbi:MULTISPECIES: alpha/beta fold hydrolase [Kitasatospora]|uniref:alpha/beta fold hydrolase n=1 Tax=Kitasatospora TaxID=2063 RepID=UPI000C70163D|nr:alpha/beta hydrolase [Kitasatospora sp. GP30]MDH6139227.1 pimeloyl-ACP methyl ester carboxylesterase [Kitasatospora sp. GP30]